MGGVFSLLLLAVVLLAGGCRSRPAGEEVWAEVNGQPIYRSQVEKSYEREVRALPEPHTAAEERAQKLNILSGLIQEEILWQKATQGGLQVSDADVEARLEKLRGAFSEQEFTHQLKAQGATLADLRGELRREMAIRKLLDHRLGSGVEVSEEEVTDYYEQYKNHFRYIETQYRVAHILITPRREQEVRNLRSDDALSEAQARQKTQRLLERLRAGEDFAALAQAYSEDPATALSGGELGYFLESALENSHPAVRRAVKRLEAGQVAGPVRTQIGYELIKLLEREPPGQRELSDPKVQDTIRQRLRRQKRQLLEAAYLAQARDEAQVINYLARQILEVHRLPP